MDSWVLHGAMLLGLACAVLHGAAAIWASPRAARLGTLCFAATAAVVTLAIVTRWIVGGVPPLASLYESLWLVAWSACIAAIGLRAVGRDRALELPAGMAVFVALGYASTLDPGVAPLVPALRSTWLFVHVVAATLAYGAFALSFGMAVVQLVRGRRSTEAAPEAARAAAQAAAVGFFFLTAAVGTGAIWARQAWGTYWGWDPKEVWSLITWLIYAAFLHFRFSRRWAGAPATWFLVLGFGAVVFTYVGVTNLLPGRHSYAVTRP